MMYNSIQWREMVDEFFVPSHSAPSPMDMRSKYESDRQINDTLVRTMSYNARSAFSKDIEK